MVLVGAAAAVAVVVWVRVTVVEDAGAVTVLVRVDVVADSVLVAVVVRDVEVPVVVVDEGAAAAVLARSVVDEVVAECDRSA